MPEYKEKLLVKEYGKYIKAKATINRVSKKFLDVTIFTNVKAEVNDYKSIWKNLMPRHLKNVALRVTKPDSYLFELK